jgi:hypothetical protein
MCPDDRRVDADERAQGRPRLDLQVLAAADRDGELLTAHDVHERISELVHARERDPRITGAVQGRRRRLVGLKLGRRLGVDDFDFAHRSTSSGSSSDGSRSSWG